MIVLAPGVEACSPKCRPKERTLASQQLAGQRSALLLPDFSYATFGDAPLAARRLGPDHLGTGGPNGPQSRNDAEGNRALDGGQRVPRFAADLVVCRRPRATRGGARDVDERFLAPAPGGKVRGVAATSSAFRSADGRSFRPLVTPLWSCANHGVMPRPWTCFSAARSSSDRPSPSLVLLSGRPCRKSTASILR